MALDGIYLSGIAQEIRQTLLGTKVDRIYQPSREELVVTFRGRAGSHKLLLSASANSARIHFTQMKLENPAQPPMFCMLLRKHLSAGRLVEVRQQGLDRILSLEFECINELGDRVINRLVTEIMGRHSNVALVGPDGRIIDAIKRVDATMSSVRQMLPGMTYQLPPSQDKLDPREHTSRELAQQICQAGRGELSKALVAGIQGISPIVAREVAHFATRGQDLGAQDLTADQQDRLAFALGWVVDVANGKPGHPTMVLDLDGRPKDLAFLEIHQYGTARITRPYEGYSQLLDAFYREQGQVERMKQRSHDLLKLLVNATERIARKLAVQRQELEQSADREHLRICGDLLNANLYALQKGDRVARVQNFYEEELPEVEIPLDPRLTPAQNAQKYYSEYKKADTAEKMLRKLIQEGEQELEYLDSVFDSVTRTTNERELTAIRQELAQQGYVRSRGNQSKKPERLPPHRYVTDDGFVVLSGRNNLQNDRLTMRESRNYDLWFHTQKIPGSHTILLTQGQEEIPNRSLEQAAIIAAANSKARDSSLVPVDYTYIKNVKKIPGAKPGMVTYDRYQTAIVTPDLDLVQRLQQE